MDFFPIICLREGEEERKKKRCVGGEWKMEGERKRGMGRRKRCIGFPLKDSDSVV